MLTRGSFQFKKVTFNLSDSDLVNMILRDFIFSVVILIDHCN